jgi:arabinofuranan 3-O-arabinosyltransferase
VRVDLGSVSVVREVDVDGSVQLPRTRTDKVTVAVLKRTNSRSLRTGGSTAAMPLVIGEVELNGRSWPGYPTDATTGRACGFGPQLLVDGRRVPTRVSGTFGDIGAGRPVQLDACEPVTFDGNAHVVSLLASGEFAPYRLSLTGADVTSAATSSSEQLVWKEYGSTSRSTSVPYAAQPRLLSVPENQNDGWTATLGGARLTGVRVDGWRQAWVVPAGAAGVVEFRFAPQRWYLAGLVSGLIAALAVVVAALRRAPVSANVGGRRPRTVGRRWTTVLTAAVFVSFAGAWGGALLIPAWVVRRWLKEAEVAVLVVGVALVAAATWSPWPQSGATNHGGLAQGLAIALVALVVSPGPQRPRRTSRAKRPE